MNDRSCQPSANVEAGREGDRHQEDWHSAYGEGDLSGIPALELPTDKPRPAVLGAATGVASRGLSPELTDGIRRTSLVAGVESGTLVLAAFCSLIYRYTAQESFAIGASPHGAQFLPVVVGFSSQPSFRQLASKVETVLWRSSEAGPVPANSIERFSVEPDPSRHPIFQVAFSAGQGNLGSFTTPIFAAPSLFAGATEAGLDLRLDFQLELSGDSQLWLRYNTDLFEAASAERMLDHMLRLIAGAIEDMDRPAAQLPMLTDRELHEHLIERNRTTGDFPRKCLHEMVEATAEKAAETIAAVHGDQQLSYSELNARANQVAHYLRKHGLGRNGRVGICLPRSLDFAVALLGVLKAGGTCVPLDPKYPSERLTLMLADVAAPIVLTEPGLLQATVPADTQVLHFSELRRALAKEPRTNSAVGSIPTDIAYIIYTSGSTGRPRGVLLPHAGLANYTQAAAGSFELRPGDRMLQFCSISFDAAVEEIFSTWVAGATLVFRRDDISLEPSEFLEWADEQRITVMDLPTAYWHEWVYAMPSLLEKVPSGVRLVIVGGEKASPEAYSTWHRQVGNRVRWINTYGPAEASVVATAYEPKLLPGELSPAVLPIGRPVANARVYLLDANLNPVPVGVPGELHIGGIGVAQGYLNLPQLTEQKFIPDIFSDDPSARLYKTGDLGRYLPSGDIEFLGRRDNQVKIRGFRVELGEIESALLQHADVHEAAVVLHEDAVGNKRLVAHVVRSQQTAAENELRRHVQKRLPDYMVPAEFIFLQKMPLTPNGKINRRALQAAKPDAARQPTPATAVADPVQAQLIKIWEELLGRKPIGIHDDFFELGGHSLLAARLMHRVKQVHGKALPLAVLLDAPTVEQLAAVLRDGWSDRWSSLVTIQPEGSKPPFFCVHGVGGNVVGFHELAQRMKPDYPFYGLQSRGLNAKYSCHTSIEEMAAHYLNEIRTVQPEGPYHLGGFSLGGLVAYEMACQLLSRGEEVGLVVLFDTYASNPKPLKESLLETLFHPTWATLQRLPDELRRKVRRTYLAWRLPEELKKVMRTNAQAAEHYRLHPYSGKAVLLRAGDTWRESDDPYAKWGELIGELETIKIPGAHMDILRDPHVSRLAERLKQCIEDAALDESRVLAKNAS
ncbi:MAG: amino acid adenylation domain-containing protein [Candidatus Sulfotelmatobacter sp.]